MTTREEVIQLVEDLPEETLDQARFLLAALRLSPAVPSREERKKALERLRGSTTHLGFTTVDLHRETQREIDREQERLARFFAAQK